MRLLALVVLLLASPWIQVGRGIMTIIACLFILKVIDMSKIDALTYGIPDEYLPFMLVGALVFGIISAFLFRSWKHDGAADNKAAKGTIPDTNSLPYDKRYDAMTVAALIIAVALGMYTAPAVVDYFVINAGVFLYAGAAALLSAVFVWIIGYALHFGIQKTIVDVAKYAVNITQTAKDAMVDIQQAINNVNDIKKK